MKLKKLTKISPSSERTKVILKHIGMSSIYKVLSISISFFLVPLSISYLGSEKYGLWLTIFSFIGWFSFFDFGIGNGLRNKLADALSKNNRILAQTYVSTAYYSIMTIVFVLVILFLMIYSFIPWDIWFNYQSEGESIAQLIVIVYIIFFVNLILKMVTVIFYADQKSSYPGLLQLLGQIIIFGSIYLTLKTSIASLLFYGIIVVGAQSLVFILTSLIVFSTKYKYLRPKFSCFNKKYMKDILSLGGKFFILQIAATLIYSTDNFIINYLFGAEQVTIYNIAFKYFMFASMGMSIILEPYWSAFTSASSKNDYLWIKNSIVNLLKLSALTSVIVIIMILSADQFYFLWVGEEIKVPFLLTIMMGVNTIIQVFMQPLIMYINGSGKIKLQMMVGLTLSIINIPLSILLAVYFNFGISGVILATIITRVIELFIYPIQVYKLINNTATGSWNA